MRHRPSWTRWIAPGLLVLGLTLSPQPAARAQDEGGGEASSGRPLDGYLATGVLCAIALFIIGKTARR